MNLNRREMLQSTGAMALGAGLSAFPFGWTAGQEGKKKKILMFTRSAGFQHSVINRNEAGKEYEKGKMRQGTPGQIAHAEQIVTDLGMKHGFDVTCTKDGRVFVPEEIAKYDAFFFYTTGDLTSEKSQDGSPPMSKEGKAAFLDAIAAGKGFLGSHCASDTFHSKGDSRKNQAPEERDPYIQMIGGEFIVHGAQQKAWMRVTDAAFPGVKDIKDFQMHEEWYALRNFAANLHVILAQDGEGMKGDMYQRAWFPATWARMHNQGRVFYTSMGHREDVWTNPSFQQILLGGIAWALRNVDANVTPNIEKVTPKASELTAAG
jgi:type 1 glutamine amidotransferase